MDFEKETFLTTEDIEIIHERNQRDLNELRESWTNLIDKIFHGSIPDCYTWKTTSSIYNVLAELSEEKNKVLLPASGHFNYDKITLNTEKNQISLCRQTFKALGDETYEEVILNRPKTLSFEYFPESPHNSFLFIETTPINSSENSIIDESTRQQGKFFIASASNIWLFSTRTGNKHAQMTSNEVKMQIQGILNIIESTDAG